MINNTKQYLVLLTRKPFVRNVAMVATGTAAAQFITIAFSPVITRLYGPEAFGIFGTFMALVAVVSPMAALTYPTAIVLPEKENEAKGIARLSMYISFGISVVLLVLILIGGDKLIELLQIQDIGVFLLLIPAVIVMTAWLQINQQWVIRKQLFKMKSKVVALHALIVNSVKSCVGLFTPLAAVLIVISVVGQALHSLMLHYGLSRSKFEKNDNHTVISTDNYDYGTIARKYKDFPYYRCPQVLLSALSNSLPVILLALFFGPSAAGFYTIGNRVLKMPFSLIGKSIGNVYYPRIAKASNNYESLKPYQTKATMGMAAIAVLPVMVIIASGPTLFGFVFGAEWVDSGHYARWLSMMVFFEFILNPSKDAIIVLSMQKMLMIYELITMIAKISMLAFGFYFFMDDVMAIILFTSTGALISIIMLVIMWNKIK